MAIKNQDHPFFRPLWRRIAIVVVTAVWCFVEWYHGQATWVFISGAICIYAIRTFLMTYPKEFPADDARPEEKEIPVMPELRLRPSGTAGRIHHVTPDSAGWTYVGFDLHRLVPGETASAETGAREVCLVFVSGTGTVSVAGEDLGTLGERMSPFEGKPWSVYVPAGSGWKVEATSPLELAVCSAPGTPGTHAARVIAPDTLGQEVRGHGTNVRHVTNILPETDAGAASLLVVEVITPGGHTSSYPPHRHDTDDLPAQSYLEETYYHRLSRPQGFGFQRVYTDARADGTRELDEAMVLEDGDVTLVPKGYHPCAATHGYDLYYLNVMAGPVRTWKFHNAAEHEWLLRKG